MPNKNYGTCVNVNLDNAKTELQPLLANNKMQMLKPSVAQQGIYKSQMKFSSSAPALGANTRGIIMRGGNK